MWMRSKLSNQDHKTDIVLDDKMSLHMKYPSLNQFISNFDTEDEAETVVDKTLGCADCMDTIFDGEDAWSKRLYKRDLYNS